MWIREREATTQSSRILFFITANNSKFGKHTDTIEEDEAEKMAMNYDQWLVTRAFYHHRFYYKNISLRMFFSWKDSTAYTYLEDKIKINNDADDVIT